MTTFWTNTTTDLTIAQDCNVSTASSPASVCSLSNQTNPLFNEQLQSFLQNAQNASLFNQIHSLMLANSNNHQSNHQTHESMPAKIKAIPTLLAMHDLLTKKKLHDDLFGVHSAVQGAASSSSSSNHLTFEAKLSMHETNYTVSFFPNRNASVE